MMLAKVLVLVKVLTSESSVEDANFHVEVEKVYTEPEEFTARPPEERPLIPRFVVVALERKVFPARVVDERKLAKVELKRPETVVEPVLATAKSVVVENTPAVLVVDARAKRRLLVELAVASTESCAHGEVVPIPTLFAKYATPVVVAPPEMVRPPARVPLPMVVEARKRLPPVKVLESPRSVEDANFHVDVE